MPSYRSRTQISSDSSAGLTTTPTLGKPAGTVDGDYLLAMFNIPHGVAVTAVPSGWSLLYDSGNVAVGGGQNARFYVYGKVASGEPASWTWTVSPGMAFYNLIVAAISGVNASTPYEQLSGTSAATQSNGSSIGLTAVTTVPGDVLTTIFFATGGSDPSFTENAGSEIFDDSGADGADRAVCLDMLTLSSAGTQNVTGTATNTDGHTLALAAVQLAFEPAAVDATVVAPAGLATAGRVAPSAGPGVGAVPAVAVASRPSALISGAQTIIVVPGTATAARSAPHASLSRIPIPMLPETPGTLELVEDP